MSSTTMTRIIANRWNVVQKINTPSPSLSLSVVSMRTSSFMSLSTPVSIGAVGKLPTSSRSRSFRCCSRNRLHQDVRRDRSYSRSTMVSACVDLRRTSSTYSIWLLTRRHGRNGRRLLSSSSSSTSASTEAATATVERPPWETLRWVAITTGIPFIGFGFLDNAILVIAGDAIDTSLGVMLGISTLCAAAIGNIISDLAGIGLGAWIEDFCVNTLKMDVPELSPAQRQLRSVRLASQGGMAVGITIGCIIGMFPLLFMDSVHKQEQLRKRAELESLFKDVVTDAKTLVGAESTCLFLRVDEHNNNKDRNSHGATENEKMESNQEPWYRRWFSPSWWWSSSFASSGITILPYRPSVEGELLYCMYCPIVKPTIQDDDQQRDDRHHNLILENKVSHASDGDVVTVVVGDNGKDQIETKSRIIPVGRGIVSRAILTGDTWNISNVNREPDFSPPPLDAEGTTISTGDGSLSVGGHHSSSSSPRKIPRPEYRNMVVVPILDSQGRAMAVIEARNKVGDKPSKTPSSETSTGREKPSTNISLVQSSFTDQDVEILKSLASHISVKLQLTYQVAEEGDDRGSLKDTIRIMKELGIHEDADIPLTDQHRRFFSQPYRRRGTRWADNGPSLFPSNQSAKQAPPSAKRIHSKSKHKLFPDENN